MCTVLLPLVASASGCGLAEITVSAGGKTHDRLDVAATAPVSVAIEGR